MGFSRQEYWSVLSFPSSGDFPDPGTEPTSSALAGSFFPPTRESLNIKHQFSSLQSLGPVWLFVTPWTAAHQASQSLTISWSLLRFMFIEPVMPSNHLISVFPFSSCLQSFPASGSFPMSWFFALGGQSIGALASASVLLMNIQYWFPLRLTGLILQSKGLARVFSNTTVQKHQFFGAQLSL